MMKNLPFLVKIHSKQIREHVCDFNDFGVRSYKAKLEETNYNLIISEDEYRGMIAIVK